MFDYVPLSVLVCVNQRPRVYCIIFENVGVPVIVQLHFITWAIISDFIDRGFFTSFWLLIMPSLFIIAAIA